MKEGADFKALKSLYESIVKHGDHVDVDLIMELARFRYRYRDSFLMRKQTTEEKKYNLKLL